MSCCWWAVRCDGCDGCELCTSVMCEARPRGPWLFELVAVPHFLPSTSRGCEGWCETRRGRHGEADGAWRVRWPRGQRGPGVRRHGDKRSESGFESAARCNPIWLQCKLLGGLPLHGPPDCSDGSGTGMIDNTSRFLREVRICVNIVW